VPFQLSESIIERFWQKVDKQPSHWLWTGSIGSHGYGELQSVQEDGKQTLTTHTISWTIHFGPIPQGLWVLHRCDIKICVRPECLFIGTQLINIQDAASKNLLRGNRIVSDIHVIRIREMYSTGNYSQAELARMFSLVPSQVSHIVRGSRKYILESERN
jgi:hypothetical protein